MIALYRKLRPKSFEQVIGQKHVTKTLLNQLKADRLSHAYLFCGTRGTGKTSTAKIFAKLLNCKAPHEGSPCGECSSCMTFSENRNIDIIEIDAASNNSVENVRDLKDEVKYPPTDGKYKIYIIDEVHMLSDGAFNALLKTLEEPPSHIVFILATTDQHKIPVTILSRCQRFDFKRITNTDVVETLKRYMVDEEVNITDNALHYIAKICDGAMRDALSILDQSISCYYGEEITLDKVLEIVGSVDDGVFFDFTQKLIDLDTTGILNLIDILMQNGRDISQFVTDTINHFRNLIVAKTTSYNNLNISDESFADLQEQAESIDTNYLIKLIDEFSKMHTTLKYSSDKRIVLEVNCIKLCSVMQIDDISDIKQKIKYLEKKLEENTNKVVYVESESINKVQENKPQKALRELAVDKDIKNIIDNYSLVSSKFEMPQKLYLEMCNPKSLEDKILYLVTEKAYVKSLEKITTEIETVLLEIFKKECKIKIISKQDYSTNYERLASKPKKDINPISDIDKMKELLPSDILEIN